MTLASRRGDGVVSAGVAPFPDAGVASLARAALSRLGPSRRAHRHAGHQGQQPAVFASARARIDSARATMPTCASTATPTLGVQAIVEVGDERPGRHPARRAGGSTVRVNGIALVDPTPLMHGDKVEIARQGAAVRRRQQGRRHGIRLAPPTIAAIVAEAAGPARGDGRHGRSTRVARRRQGIHDSRRRASRSAATRARTWSSRENEVSRKHAEIMPGRGRLRASRLQRERRVRQRRAGRERRRSSRASDVIRVGTEEFRFYADVRPARSDPGDPTAAVPRGSPRRAGARHRSFHRRLPPAHGRSLAAGSCAAGAGARTATRGRCSPRSK